jgi:hypothetical protein
MKPPIFPPLTSPLPSLDWHARARMYRDQVLGMPDIVNGQPNWPRYFLLAHAAELAIRAVLVHAKTAGGRTAGQEPGNHDLAALYAHACTLGLKSNPKVLDELQYLSEIHKNHVARYPKSLGQVWCLKKAKSTIVEPARRTHLRALHISRATPAFIIFWVLLGAGPLGSRLRLYSVSIPFKLHSQTAP